MAAFIDDAVPWLLAALTLCGLVGSCYGAVKWARKQLKDVVLTDIHPSLEHLHDCVERIESAVTVQAENAAAEAASARAAADEAKAAAAEAQEAVLHITEWQAKVDTDLRNIQQMQVTFPSRDGE